MLNLRTAHYRYSGNDRLDVTVKGQHQFGKFLAPRWDMVMAVKNHGRNGHPFYIREYSTILNSVPEWVWAKMLNEERITLVCFCNEHEFCHRNLIIDYMRDYRQFPVCYSGWVV